MRVRRLTLARDSSGPTAISNVEYRVKTCENRAAFETALARKQEDRRYDKAS